MVAEYAFRCCRVCGGDINLDAQICPFCGSLQQAKKKNGSTLLIIGLAVLGFFGIMSVGIISAFTIPRFIGFRTNTCNAIALRNVSTAKSGLEMFRFRNGRLPETLDTISFAPDDGVTVTLLKSAAGNYRLVGFHKQGDREYLAVSGKTVIFCRERDRPGTKYLQVE
jgi:predicted nucleic acid-binding Zn ribbon protein